MTRHKQKQHRERPIGKTARLQLFLVVLAAFLGAAFFRLCGILDGLTLDVLLFHLNAPAAAGANYSVVWDGAKKCLPWGVLGGCAAGISFRLLRARKRGWLSAAVSAALLVGGLVSLAITVQIPQYITSRFNTTAIFEDRYVDPRTAEIAFPQTQRNLIYIVLESGEATCLDRASGGSWDHELLSEMTRLKEDNISFSDFCSIDGASWTMGALVAQSSGLPLKLPFEYNSYGKASDLLFPNVITLGDCLSGAGYRNIFLCGSDAAYAGRGKYFRQHGGYEIFDLKQARQEGALPEDYFVFWGYEDQKLYSFAQEKLLSLAQSPQPFNLTMLTVDTHFNDGYLCGNCPDKYDTQYENVLACMDDQLGEFIRWIQRQDFYKDTTVVIVGDHPYMDHEFYRGRGIQDADRRIYNCILNPADKPSAPDPRRTFTSLDLFPTILSALGTEWNGNALGLGVDLFSGAPTLAEELGIQELNSQLNMRSSFYDRRFLYGEIGS